MATESATLLPMLPSGTVLRARGRALWRKLEQLTVYVPVVLMALLALASYWLLRSTPEVPVPVAKAPPQHVPTDVMRGFSVRTYGPGGALRSEVFGREARMYPDDGSMEIDDSRIRHISPQGVVTTSVAQRVWANSAHDEFVLTGNAVVVREATTLPTGEKLQRLEFQGPHLHVHSTTRRVSSDQPVLLIRGDSRMTANQMTYTEDDHNRVAVLTGRVRATLVGQKGR